MLRRRDFTNPAFRSREPPWRLRACSSCARASHMLGASKFAGAMVPTVGAGPRSAEPPRRQPDRDPPSVHRLRRVAADPEAHLRTWRAAQYAWNPLLSFEQFCAGNYTVGRGYEPGDLLGDRGLGTQAEVRFGSRIPPSASSAGSKAMSSGIMRPSTTSTSAVFRDGLHASGFGRRRCTYSFDRFDLDAGVAVPLTRIGIDDRRPPVRLPRLAHHPPLALEYPMMIRTVHPRPGQSAQSC